MTGYKIDYVGYEVPSVPGRASHSGLEIRDPSGKVVASIHGGAVDGTGLIGRGGIKSLFSDNVALTTNQGIGPYTLSDQGFNVDTEKNFNRETIVEGLTREQAIQLFDHGATAALNRFGTNTEYQAAYLENLTTIGGFLSDLTYTDFWAAVDAEVPITSVYQNSNSVAFFVGNEIVAWAKKNNLGVNWNPNAFFELEGNYPGYLGGYIGPLQRVKCFLSGTPISMFDGSTKPIENIAANDTVLSYDKNGDLTPGRVVRTFQNTVKQILDVHGLMVTPGHVTLCGDGTFKGQHVAMLDILRSDGALVLEDGSMVRAATGCAVGSEGDRMITAIIGEAQPDGKIKVTETGKIRLGTRFILETGQDVSMIDLITANGGVVTNEGLIQTGVEGVEMPFRWTFTSSLPKPENYVLQRSATQLEDICQANEWEAVLPKMSGPISHKTDGGPSRGAPINVPLSMRA